MVAVANTPSMWLVIKGKITLNFHNSDGILFIESESEVAQHVRLFVTPRTVAHQAPQSIGFSRQEYWSGLPFPSLYENIKTHQKRGLSPTRILGERALLTVCVCVLVAQSCLTLCSPMDCSPPSSSVHGILQARILKWVYISFSTINSSRLYNIIITWTQEY